MKVSKKDKPLLKPNSGPLYEPKSLPLQVMEDMPSLPSVRQLALQFSATAKTDEADSVPVSRRRKTTKDVVIVKKNEGSEARIEPPLQVHSLTARSISREFREGLRQSQQAPLGKPVTNPSEQNVIRKNANGEQNQDETKSVCLPESFPLRESQSLYDGTLFEGNSRTFNGGHSREGTPSGDSITEETYGPLRNVEGGIAFWERLSPLGAPANTQEKGT